MVGTIDIELQAARPNMPLPPVFSFVGSPTSVRLRNVPRKVGEWEITKVCVTAQYPDNTNVSAECVLTGGVWVGTVGGSDACGKSDKGFVITASGTDENGEEVEGYVLGVGTLVVMDRDGSLTVGDTTYNLHLVQSKPETPHKGDITADTLEMYDGEKWVQMGQGDSPVRSVNGKTGEVVIDADDVCALPARKTGVMSYDLTGLASLKLPEHTEFPDSKYATKQEFDALEDTVNRCCVQSVSQVGDEVSFTSDDGSVRGTISLSDYLTAEKIRDDKDITAYDIAVSVAKPNETVGGHIGDHANPHGVTAEQVGAYTTVEVDAKVSELSTAVGGAQSTAGSAQSTASEALASAAEAQATATTANGKADAALGTAATAKTTAEEAATGLADRVAKTGDTMTGGLVVKTTGSIDGVMVTRPDDLSHTARMIPGCVTVLPGPDRNGRLQSINIGHDLTRTASDCDMHKLGNGTTYEYWLPEETGTIVVSPRPKAGALVSETSDSAYDGFRVTVAYLGETNEYTVVVQGAPSDYAGYEFQGNKILFFSLNEADHMLEWVKDISNAYGGVFAMPTAGNAWWPDGVRTVCSEGPGDISAGFVDMADEWYATREGRILSSDVFKGAVEAVFDNGETEAF